MAKKKSARPLRQGDYKALFSLRGKNAVVTGGAGVLGHKFCAALASFGSNVAVVDIQEKAAERLAAQLARRYGVKAVGVGCDVSSADSVRSMAAYIAKNLGPIHILHNNAASKTRDLDAYFAPFENYSLKTWREAMAVNLDGMFLVAQAVGNQMLRQKTGGSIIQTASIYGVMAPDQRIYKGSHFLGRSINTPAVYSASKFAVVGLTKYLATYWAGKGIRVNALSPGGNDTGQNDTFKKLYSARVPMGRMGFPDEMTGALVYLASEASSYVTGQNIVVDGGLEAW